MNEEGQEGDEASMDVHQTIDRGKRKVEEETTPKSKEYAFLLFFFLYLFSILNIFFSLNHFLSSLYFSSSRVLVLMENGNGQRNEVVMPIAQDQALF